MNDLPQQDRIRVLIVDDSAVIRAVITRTISAHADMEVAGVAPNGEAAVRAAALFKPDIVILDIEMPVMDGITALPLILKEAPQTRVVICSTLSARGADISLKALSLGAKAAEPNRPVVAIVGDGGFGHSWAELETMMRMCLPVTVVVLNNGILGFQRDAETVKFGQYTSACHFNDVDHAALAKACGCPSIRVDDPALLAPALKRGIEGEGPLLIEVMADPQAHPPLSLFAQMDEAA